MPTARDFLLVGVMNGKLNCLINLILPLQLKWGAAMAQWLRRLPTNPRSLTAVGSSPGRTTCGKGFFLAVGPYWLARCQYNVTEWHAVLICDIVCQ